MTCQHTFSMKKVSSKDNITLGRSSLKASFVKKCASSSMRDYTLTENGVASGELSTSITSAGLLVAAATHSVAARTIGTTIRLIAISSHFKRQDGSQRAGKEVSGDSSALSV